MSTKEDDELPPGLAEEILLLSETVLKIKDRPSQLLRLHALSEWYIERILTVFLKQPEVVLKDSRFTYSHKLKLAKALNALPEKIIDALRRLSKLRNECAHSMMPVITDSQIKDASQPIMKDFKKYKEDHKKDGLDPDILHIYVWTLFTELSISVAPIEQVYNEIFENNA